MLLTWADGTEHSIEYRHVRYWCPCAKCGPRRDSEDLDSVFRVELKALPIEKPTIKMVGTYALHFEWTSGCSSGIHRFERLWAIANEEHPDDGKPYTHGAW